MGIFGRFRRKKIEPEKLIKDFEVGRQILLKKTHEIADELKKQGYSVLEMIPLLVSVGKADKDSPFGIMIVVTSDIFRKFHEYVDKGKYSNNKLNMFYMGEYSFLLIVARDDDKKLAICYPTAFRKKHVGKLKGKNIIYIYIIDAQTSKYTLIYFPNVVWGVEKKSEINITEESKKNSEPPKTLYR
ncbi:MAG: hypothetical protein NDF54_09710 [archaeon GB-1867-035]|nr:hypothetical protein [Candidatus Culexmicrobium profundum]